MKFRKEETGSCTCICEPRGEHGLEGYQLDEKYLFERMVNNDTDKVHFKVYPCGIDYAEYCKKGIFRRYFKESEK